MSDAVTVLIPTPLRPYTDHRDAVAVSAGNVGELLERLTARHGELRRHLFGDDGRLRNFVNVYVNDEDIRYLQRLDTPLKAGDTVSLVPAIAGGVPEAARSAGEVTFTHEEIKRYSRHLILPEVGLQGQARLKASSALIIGTGGLGAPLALYLAAAGVGRLGLVDFDTVEASNLQRQVLFTTADVGHPKAQAAQERLHALNPEIRIEVHERRLTSANALDLVKDYDVVVDGTDNFPTRYLVNDACVLLKKPNVYASIFRFEGQVTVFWAERGPCYRCLYAEPPPPGLVPSCAEGGVLGVLPGIVGAIQANEAIKVLLGKGEPLVGRLLLFDALRMRFRELRLRKDPDCVACGPNATVKALIDYEEFCGVRGQEQLEAEWQVEPEGLKQRRDAGEPLVLVDVREPQEYEIARIEGSTLIPLGQLPQRAHELSTADEIVVHCHTGSRSARAVQFLRELGFRRVKNLAGGIEAWSVLVDPSVPRY